LIKEELDTDAQILLQNKGLTKLLFFSGIKDDKNTGITLLLEEEIILTITDLGEGKSLSVENLSSDRIGSYRVKL